jgi:hypothetical protein
VTAAALARALVRRRTRSTRYEDLLHSGLVDAVIVADAQRPALHALTLAALDQRLSTCCARSRWALTYAETPHGWRRAPRETGAICMTPFTYRYMPVSRYVKRLLDDGLHWAPVSPELSATSPASGSAGGYNWRFDENCVRLRRAGRHRLPLPLPGVVVLRRHHRGLRRTWGGCSSGRRWTRAGSPIPQADDNAMIMLKFASGAQGLLHASTVAPEATPFGQLHELDLHGDGRRAARPRGLGQRAASSAGRVHGVSRRWHELPIPDDHLARARGATRCTTPTAMSSAPRRR